MRSTQSDQPTLPVRKRKLETESGENFAERLQQFAILSSGGATN
jgi:hypothetical protein